MSQKQKGQWFRNDFLTKRGAAESSHAVDTNASLGRSPGCVVGTVV
jgi:hypothetical protein